MTTDQKSKQYSGRISNQSGVYTKGEIETAYVTGYSEAEQEAMKAFDIYLRNYQGLDASGKRYKILMDDFKNIMGGTLYQQLPSFNLEKYLEEVHRLSFENMGNACREYLKKEGHSFDKCNCHVNEEKKRESWE